MTTDFLKLRGVPPSVILKRELKKKGFSQREFALLIEEHPQTLNAILKQKRKIPIDLALKIEKQLEMEEGILSVLQVYFEIEQRKKNKEQPTPNLKIITKGLFWDIDFQKMDWIKYADFAIQRTFERGTLTEKKEMILFYGKEKVKKSLALPQRKKIKNYINI